MTVDDVTNTRKSLKMPLQEQTRELLKKIVNSRVSLKPAPNLQTCSYGRYFETLNMGFPLLVELGATSYSTSACGDIPLKPSVPI